MRVLCEQSKEPRRVDLRLERPTAQAAPAEDSGEKNTSFAANAARAGRRAQGGRGRQGHGCAAHLALRCL